LALTWRQCTSHAVAALHFWVTVPALLPPGLADAPLADPPLADPALADPSLALARGVVSGCWGARRRTTLPSAAPGCNAHQVDHGRNRRDQYEQHDRKCRPGPPRPQYLAEARLAERRQRAAASDRRRRCAPSPETLLIQEAPRVTSPPPAARPRRDFSLLSPVGRLFTCR
jgi:hypothetical protein